MQMGKDFFKWFKLIVALVRLIAEIFGDDDDKEQVNDATHTKDGSDVTDFNTDKTERVTRFAT